MLKPSFFENTNNNDTLKEILIRVDVQSLAALLLTHKHSSNLVLQLLQEKFGLEFQKLLSTIKAKFGKINQVFNGPIGIALLPTTTQPKFKIMQNDFEQDPVLCNLEQAFMALKIETYDFKSQNYVSRISYINDVDYTRCVNDNDYVCYYQRLLQKKSCGDSNIGSHVVERIPAKYNYKNGEVYDPISSGERCESIYGGFSLYHYPQGYTGRRRQCYEPMIKISDEVIKSEVRFEEKEPIQLENGDPFVKLAGRLPKNNLR